MTATAKAPPRTLAESLRRAAKQCDNARLRRVLLALANGDRAASAQADADESQPIVDVNCGK